MDTKGGYGKGRIPPGGGGVCVYVKRCNAKGGDYENGDSSKWRQRWAWGYIGGNTSSSAKGSILGRWGKQKGDTKGG